jgi:hypothetical protein
MEIGKAVKKTISESFGIICITAGVNAILAGQYALGIFLIIVGLASLFAEKFIE